MRRNQPLAATRSKSAAKPAASGRKAKRTLDADDFTESAGIAEGTGLACAGCRLRANRPGSARRCSSVGVGPRSLTVEIEPPLDLPVGVLRQTDRPGLGDALQARGDVDAVAHQIAVALFDDVAEMDADPKFDALSAGTPALRSTMAVLDFDGAAHGVDDAAELDDAPSPVRLTTRP